MTGVFRRNAYRTAGAVEAGLYFDDLTVEVIADGKHLPKGLLQLIYKCKGADKICLITDAMRGAGSPDGTETVLGRLADGVPCIIEDGVAKLYDRQSFAGSVATTDRLLAVMHSLAEVELPEISKMLSATPARLMGLFDRGSLEVGKRADIVILNKDLKIKNSLQNANNNDFLRYLNEKYNSMFEKGIGINEFISSRKFVNICLELLNYKYITEIIIKVLNQNATLKDYCDLVKKISDDTTQIKSLINMADDVMFVHDMIDRLKSKFLNK